jgi:hypothetical protein
MSAYIRQCYQRTLNKIPRIRAGHLDISTVLLNVRDKSAEYPVHNCVG